MEKNRESIQEEIFTKKYLKEIKLQKPGKDFTTNLMGLLAKEGELKLAKSQPLISKKAWLFVASFVGVCLFVVVNSKRSINLSFSELNWNFLPKMEIPNFLPSVSISNMMLLFFGLFTLFFLVQISFLKNHFERQFEV